jgi:rhodanese-related sulfurtransferase
MTASRIDVDRARDLIEHGAVVIDALEATTYAQQHLPGAINIPLTDLNDAAVAGLDRDAPVVVYCFDQRCDLSARMSARLDAMGFSSVNDLIGGRAAWTVLGLPTEGEVADRRRLRDHLRPATTVRIDQTIGDVPESAERRDGDGAPVAIVGHDGVLLGALDVAALKLPADTPVLQAMISAPGTIRPDLRLDDALKQLTDDGLSHSFVSTARGELLGLVFAADHV